MTFFLYMTGMGYPDLNSYEINYEIATFVYILFNGKKENEIFGFGKQDNNQR